MPSLPPNSLPLHAIGFGCMRLSTARDRGDDANAVAVIHAALDAGATLLDTSDAYCLDDSETGHNERLVARALESWNGDRSRVVVATKGGIRRPKGAWLNDGRAKHLREACDASRRALGVETIDLYQLHAVDPKTSIETSVRALAALREEGKVRQIGLCNVTVGQIEAARSLVEISSVQVSLSVVDDENFRNGVAEYCRDNGIQLIAYRPLGGERAKKLGKDPTLAAIAKRHETSARAVALAWLMSFDANLVPIPGATRVETAAALAAVRGVVLDADERREMDARFAGRLLRVRRAERQPPGDADGDVVLVMGMPGAGKTTIAKEFEARGYARLNRDALGGSLADLVPRLDASLASGQRRVVLDNTYPTRKSRNEVIECAWSHGVPVRCLWMATELPDAQVNAIERMIDAHGALPSPGEIRERGKKDSRYLGPDAQFRYERTVEPPSADEGFTSVERRAFVRSETNGTARAAICDFDELVARPDFGQALARLRASGWLVFAHAWRPQVARGELSMDDALAQLALDATVSCCPHDAGPPVCWCRKPLPGLLLEFARKHDVSLASSVIVGTSAADRTMAQRLGIPLETPDAFFASSQT